MVYLDTLNICIQEAWFKPCDLSVDYRLGDICITRVIWREKCEKGKYKIHMKEEHNWIVLLNTNKNNLNPTISSE